MSDILEREKADRPNNDSDLRHHLCKNCKWINKEEFNMRYEVCRCYQPKNIIERQNKLLFDHVDKKSIACYHYEKRTEENKEDLKETEQYKLMKKYGYYL